MKINKQEIIGLITGVILIVASLIFIRNLKLLSFLIVISLLIIALPFIISISLKSGKQKEKEKRFLDFIRDLVENVKSGTPINKGISNVKNRDYGVLSPHVLKLANQLNLGIPLSKAFANFAKETKSRVISRSVNLISEAERAGGEISEILESVSESVNLTENLKKEQKAGVYNLVVQGYIIFIVFIIIMLVLQFYILPLMEGVGSIDDLGGSVQNSNFNPDDFAVPLISLLIVQSIFAGLVIGKISEGNIREGIKHSFILLALVLVILTGANAFF